MVLASGSGLFCCAALSVAAALTNRAPINNVNALPPHLPLAGGDDLSQDDEVVDDIVCILCNGGDDSRTDGVSNDILLCDGYKKTLCEMGGAGGGCSANESPWSKGEKGKKGEEEVEGGEEEEGTYAITCHCADPRAKDMEGSFHQLCCFPPVFVLPRLNEDWRCTHCQLKIRPKPVQRKRVRDGDKAANRGKLSAGDKSHIAKATSLQLSRLRGKVERCLRDVTNSESVIRAYTETRRSQQVLAKGIVPSELLAARKTCAKSKLAVRILMLTLEAYITEPPRNGEPRFDSAGNTSNSNNAKVSDLSLSSNYWSDGSDDDDDGIDAEEIYCCLCRGGGASSKNDLLRKWKV